MSAVDYDDVTQKTGAVPLDAKRYLDRQLVSCSSTIDCPLGCLAAGLCRKLQELYRLRMFP
jgi:hypothetical protein